MDQPKKIMSNIQNIKQRFGIIGNDSQLNFALEKAIRVAPTEISAVSYTHLTLPTSVIL